MQTRVKICGITRIEDASSAVNEGADAIGLIFYAPSPRNVDINIAAEIVKQLPPFVSVVGLFVNADQAWVDDVLLNVPIDLMQFHGEETPAYCRQFGKPYMKAIRVRESTNLLQYEDEFSDARALLLDTFVDGAAGGTGKTFDWNLIPKTMVKPVVLAGGLNATNVTEAIRKVRPYAVDVSGGVEQSKGIKSAEKIAAFMRGVSNASL